MKNVHRDFLSEEPRCNRGPRDWQLFFFIFAIQCNPYITKLYMTTPSVERTILFSTRNSKLYMKCKVGICDTAHVDSSFYFKRNSPENLQQYRTYHFLRLDVFFFLFFRFWYFWRENDVTKFPPILFLVL